MNSQSIEIIGLDVKVQMVFRCLKWFFWKFVGGDTKF